MYPLAVFTVLVGAMRMATCLPLNEDLSSMIFMPGDIPLMLNTGDSGSQGRTDNDETPAGNTRRVALPPEDNGTPSAVTLVDGVECGPKYGTVVYNGTCERLLTQSLCSQGEWLVKRKESNEGVCVTRNCSQGQLYFEEKCVAIDDKTVCSHGQMLYVELTGHVHCDCEPNYFYDPYQGKCFTQHERGSCNFGKYLEVTNSGRIVCVPNPCQIDGFLRNEVDRRCYRKMYSGICSYPHSVVFTEEDLTVHCIAHSPHTIFDLPTMKSCPLGSLRDFSGSCREDYRVAVEKIYPAAFGKCLKGFVIDPMGKCRKANRLFR